MGASCPFCGAAATFVDGAWGPQSARGVGHYGERTVVVLLDNVRSLRNVGAIFRTADGLGAAHLDLCGITPRGDHPKLEKTALGAQDVVSWAHHNNATEALSERIQGGAVAICLEGGPEARPISEVREALPADVPAVLVLGHEVSGVDPRVQALCTYVAAIPMVGIKDSLNVASAFAIALWELRREGS